MKVKALIAGLLLSASGISQAAKIADGVSSVSGGAPTGIGETANVTNGGDVFLIVHDDVLDTTYVQNLETDFVAFKNTQSSAAKSFPLDQAGKDFLAAAGSTFQWAVFAGNNIRGFLGSPRTGGYTSFGNVADWGLLTTGGVAGTAGGFNPDANNMSTVVTGNLAQNVTGMVNTGLSDTVNSAVFPANDPANFRTKGTTLGGAQVYNGNGTNAALGETSTFWFVTNDYLHTAAEGGGPKVTQLGSFKLTAAALDFTPAGGGGGTATPVLGTIDAFGDQAVGSASTAKTVTLGNTGTAAYAIQSIAADGDFAATNDCSGSVAAGGSCNIQVTFTPTVAGARTGTLTVTPTSGTPLTLSLSGNGVAATVTPVLGTIDAFGDQVVGSTSTAKAVTLTNNGSAAYAISTITANGDFSASDNCGTSLAAGANCTINITFTPTAAGARTGTLTVTPATGTPLTLALSGTGTAATAEVVFGTLDAFASQAVGTTSTAKTVTLTNNGTAAYGISSIGTGTGSEFAVTTHDCGTSLAASASCTISVTFTPTAAGARTGTLTVTPATGTPLTLALSGTGTATTTGVVLGTIDAFGNQSVGIASSAKTVTLTNNGTAAYPIQSIAASGDFALTHDCGTSLAGGANCSIQVTFTPVLAGARSGKLTVTPGTGDALTLDLSGTGVIPANLAVSPTQLDFGAVATGKKAQLTVTLRNTGSANLTVGGVTSPDAPFAKLKDGCSSKVLKSGKSCTVGYKFAPTGEDTFSATSTITADGVDPVVVTLSGTTGAPGQLAVDPGPSQDIGFGDQFSLTGQEFTSVRGKVLVKGKPAKILVWTDTLIIAKAPKLGAGTYEVEVVRKGRKPTGTGQASVTVHAPELGTLSPTSGGRGSELTLTGRYFGGGKPAVFFKRSGGGRKITAPLGSSSDTELQVTVPKRLPVGDYEVTVATAAGTSAAATFTVTAE